MTTADREQQLAQAEELLGDQDLKAGLAAGFFFGQFQRPQLLPYPRVDGSAPIDELVKELTQFCSQELDPKAIDRYATLPDEVITRLGQLGVLGACMPRDVGGLELSQVDYCRVLEVLGGHCASTSLFVNAHHSIGPRALVLFGTPEQQQKWLPKLVTGEWISAFALTESEAGSDAANVQTTATPTEDGRGFLVNGQKQWITNGGIAQMLTVMARTPVDGSDKSAISALIVTPDMPGFQVVEKSMEKVGVRGSVTSRLAFHDMFVPQENILGTPGKGLKMALTVLDYGRTTFGASCTGSAKNCLQLAATHARERVQFGQSIGQFEMVKEKLARMQAGVFAMEACTYQTAALMDSGTGDFMVETAMLKVLATEQLWSTIYDTFQIFGGKAFFTDQPIERMMRDARINMIGEGANDVLRAFIALVGMRQVGQQLQRVLHAVYHPFGNLSILGQFTRRKLATWIAAPEVDLGSSELQPQADQLARDIRQFGIQVERLLRRYQLEIVDRQYILQRVADVATELYAGASVMNRMLAILRHEPDGPARRLELDSGRYYLATSHRRIRNWLKALWDNDDPSTTGLADRLLKAQG